MPSHVTPSPVNIRLTYKKISDQAQLIVTPSYKNKPRFKRDEPCKLISN